MSNHTHSRLFIDAMAADDAYHAEMRRLYGAEAKAANYDERAEATPELRALLLRARRYNHAILEA